MGKKRLIILAVLLAAIPGATLFLVVHSREPAYNGKSLSAWLDQYGANHWSNHHDLDHEAEDAIRHFGTNLIPGYLRMLSTQPSSTKMKLLGHIPSSWGKHLHLPTTNEYELAIDGLRSRGAYGIIALGPDAKPAITQLIALLTNRVDRVRYLSVFSIRCLGPVAHDALPAVLNCLNDSDDTVRDDAITALGTIQEDPERVVPVLIKAIEENRNSSHFFIEEDAIRALSNFKRDAAAAVPVIIKSLDAHDASIRQAAALALGNIRSRPDLTVPALTAHFARAKETSMNDLMIFFSSVAQFGPDARSAVPALLEYARDHDRDLRAGALDTLKQIDPDAAAKADIK